MVLNFTGRRLFHLSTEDFTMFTAAEPELIQKRYEDARQQYALLAVDTEAALQTLSQTAISLHCWQGDDVRGFEVHQDAVSGGGIMSTGNYPGAAMDADTLRADAEKALALIPGPKRFNLHAIYAETEGQTVPRDQIGPQHFDKWMQWSRKMNLPLDFNPTFFAHPLANDGFTLSHPDQEIREFWVRHAIACRRIAAAMGQNQNCPCIINHWLPDGSKDQPIDRLGPRQRLLQSLEQVFSVDIPREYCRDAVECKLFGLGSEDYVVGSHEFYLCYTQTHPQMLCFDMGHFHPTETIHDKLSAVLLFQDELLLHVSRGVRWDSDHVVICNDDLQHLCQQIVRGNFLPRVHFALDFFDGSINRVGAWVVGTRATQKALLAALLEPTRILQSFEDSGDGAMKLALLEELKQYPLGAVWDWYCLQHNVPPGAAWIDILIDYDRRVLKARIQ
jgi:L-rhamnose isomerase